MINFGAVPSGAVLPVIFDAFDGGTGASITLTGLAITDVEIYKGTSMTQRASDAGVVLIDTDGIDLDGVTGIHGFSIDTGDNTDAGFYAVGSFFTVIVASVTIDAQTVNFVAATFRLVAAEAIAGKPKADVDAWLGTAAATPTVAGVPEVDLTHVAGAAVSTTTAQLGVNVVQLSADATAADNAEAFFDGTGYAGTGNTIPTVTTVGTLTTYTGNTPQTGDSFARLGATGSGLTTLATQASVNTIDDFLDTEVAAIITTLGTPAGASLSADIAAIEGQTDDIGAAGVGLTAVPWNAAWDAEVQSEVADALAVYDPPTQAELVSEVDAVQAQLTALNNLAAGAAMTLTAGERTAIADALRARQLTEGYAADGVAPTLEQAVFMIMQGVLEFGIVGVTKTTRKMDKSTTAYTHTLNDATSPTNVTRAT